MNAFITNLSGNLAIVKNKHVSVPLLLAIGCEAGKIWMPAHVTQWDATQKLLFTYGILSAANSGPGNPPNGKETNTSEPS